MTLAREFQKKGLDILSVNDIQSFYGKGNNSEWLKCLCNHWIIHYEKLKPRYNNLNIFITVCDGDFKWLNFGSHDNVFNEFNDTQFNLSIEMRKDNPSFSLGDPALPPSPEKKKWILSDYESSSSASSPSTSYLP